MTALTIAAEPIAALADLTDDEWRELRRSGIGGSDASTVCGINPWESPVSLWLDKTGIRPSTFEGNRFTDWGHRLEDAVATYYADTTGHRIERPAFMYRHPEHPFMLANPDRFIVTDPDDPGVLEVKTADRRHLDEWGDEDGDDVPAHYLLQLHHYLAVTGCRWGAFVALIGGNEPRVRRIEQDPELAAMLIDREAEFWQLVEEQTMPPTDGSEATADALARLWPSTIPDPVELDPDHATAVAELRNVKAEIKALEATRDELEAFVKAALGEHDTGTVDGRAAVTWKTQARRSLQIAGPGIDPLAHTHPTIARYFTKTTEFRRFLVKPAPKGR